MFGPAEMNDTLSSKITCKKTMAYNLLRSMEIFGFDFDTLHNSKGQIKSEWIYEIINFQKK